MRVVLLTTLAAVCAAGLDAPVSLRTEYLASPGLSVDTPSPRFSWSFPTPSERGLSQVSYHITLSDTANTVVWDSSDVKSNSSVFAPYGGPALSADTRYSWTVTWTSADGRTSPASAPCFFDVGLLTDADWSGAEWLGSATQRQIRVSFSLPTGTISRAVAYVAAPGGCITTINGASTAMHTGMAPWLTFSKFSVYRTIDLSKAVNGDNVVGFLLGQGFYGENTALRVKLSFTVDGKDMVVTSKANSPVWQATRGPVIVDDPWAGFQVDYRLAQPGWDTPSFSNASAWPAASPQPKPPTGALANSGVAIPDDTNTHSVANVIQAAGGDKVYDFGVNVVGVTRAVVKGPAGASVTIIHGEFLTANLTVATNYSSRDPEDFQKDVFTLAGGDAPVTVSALFSWHGFQYAQVALAGGAELVSIESVERGTSTPQISELTFPDAASDPVAQRMATMHRLTLQTQRNNFAGGLPTDCPTREKHGWLGDALATAEEALYNFDMTAIYNRYLTLITNDQDPAGPIPGVVPAGASNHEFDNSWTAAFAIIPDWVHLYTGDSGLIHAHYIPIKTFVDNLIATVSPTTKLNDASTWGDWCAPQDRKVEVPETAPIMSAFNYLNAVNSMSRLASIAGTPADAAKYASVFQAGRPAYHKAYYNASAGIYGVYPVNYGTLTAAPLAIDAVPADLVDSVVANLKHNLVDTLQNHFGIGSVGAKNLFTQLTRVGLTSVAVDLLMQDTYPSFGHWLALNATTCWESWSGYPDLSHPPTPTHGHIFLCGGLDEWMWRSVAGIEPVGAGYSAIAFGPAVNTARGPFAVNATVNTPAGVAAISWKYNMDSSQFSAAVTAPVSSTATVYVPLVGLSVATASVSVDGGAVWERGEYKPGVAGVTGAALATRNNQTVLAVGISSGVYNFQAAAA